MLLSFLTLMNTPKCHRTVMGLICYGMGITSTVKACNAYCQTLRVIPCGWCQTLMGQSLGRMKPC